MGGGGGYSHLIRRLESIIYCLSKKKKFQYWVYQAYSKEILGISGIYTELFEPPSPTHTHVAICISINITQERGYNL